MDMSIAQVKSGPEQAAVIVTPASEAAPTAIEPKPVSSDYYLSPVMSVDPSSLVLLLQFRDSKSGEVLKQFPPEYVVERYRQGESRPIDQVFGGPPVSASSENKWQPDPELSTVGSYAPKNNYGEISVEA